MSFTLKRPHRGVAALAATALVAGLATIGTLAPTVARADTASEAADGMAVTVSPAKLPERRDPADPGFTLSVNDANGSGATFSDYLITGVPAGWVVTVNGTPISAISPSPVIYQVSKASLSGGAVSVIPPVNFTGSLSDIAVSRVSKSPNLITDFDNGTFDYLGESKPKLPAVNTSYAWDDPTVIEANNYNQYGPWAGQYTVWPTGNINGPGPHYNNLWADLRSATTPLAVSTNVVCGMTADPWDASVADHSYQVSDEDSAASGKILIVNGSIDMPVPNNLIQTTVTGLKKNTNYSFSGLIANLSDSSGAVGAVQSAFFAGTELIGSSAPAPKQSTCYNDGTRWLPTTSLVNTGDSTSLTLGVRNFGEASFGNDVAIDELKLFPMAQAQVDLVVEDTPPMLSVVKDDGKTIVRPGESTTYTITVSNAEDAGVAEDVTLTDELPQELRFDSASDGGTYADGTVTWNLGALAPGESVSVTVSATVNADVAGGIEIVNHAKVDTTEGCDAESCEAIDVDNTPAVVSITKTDHKTIVGAGEKLDYELTVKNESASTEATGVVVTDSLPGELEFVSASDGGTYDADARVVTWDLGSLAAGAERVVTVSATVNADVAGGIEIVNHAKVDTTEGCDAESCEAIDVDNTPATPGTPAAPAATGSLAITGLDTVGVTAAVLGALAALLLGIALMRRRAQSESD